MSKNLYPCLWFDGNAQEAAQFYCGIFKEAKIIASTPMVVKFELMGEIFMALNGGPAFKFNEAISFVVECENQEEVDFYWENLSKNGKEKDCGWLQDQYGLSWQIVPKILSKLMSDPAKAPKVFQAFQHMQKFDIAQLVAAAE